MRSSFKPVLVFLVLLISALHPCLAQNNKYKLDDSCYPLYRTADSLIGNPEAEAYIIRLEEQAQKVHDDKALTIAGVLRLRQATRMGQETEVLVCYGDLKETALATGYLQYYFYAYQLVSVYYINQENKIKGMDYAVKMHDEAVRMNNDYGIWQSARHLSELYLADYRRSATVETLKEVARTYESTEDPVIRAQSISKVYSLLAMLNGYASEEYSGYMEKAMASAKISVDSLYAEYALACHAAVVKDVPTYRHYRDICRSNTMFVRARATGEVMFEITDHAINNEWKEVRNGLKKISRLEDLLYVSDLGVAFDRLDIVQEAFVIITSQLSSTYESKLKQSLAESEVMLENELLNNYVIDQTRRANRIFVGFILFIIVAIIIVGSLIYLYIKRLRKMRTEADAENAMKTQFVQNMSHEIRTPLNAVVGFSQLLAVDPTLSEEDKTEYLSYITNNSELLMMLIDDILDLTDINNGNYKMSLSECNCNNICRQALNTVQYKLPFGVKTRFESSVPDDLAIISDERRVQQILINFLTNSCKHTSSGEILVKCDASVKPGYVTFAVQDTGIGISPDKADKLFGRFSRLDDNTKGHGLGLNICKMLSEKMDGIVELDRTYGRVADPDAKGARFLLHLPLKR